MIEVYKEFTFDAAHHLATNVVPGHPYARLHGHSFTVAVYVRGEPDVKTGWIIDLAELEAAIRPVHDLLDHNYLNDIKGLELPTLENLSRWIWEQIKPRVPQLHRIVVRRGTLGEGCVYEGFSG